MSLIALPGIIPVKRIALQTRKGTDIENCQPEAFSSFCLNQAADFPREYPLMKLRSAADAVFNCHGLTFASRRTCIEEPLEVRKILHEDCYKPVDLKAVEPGDIIIYVAEDGDIEHSGIVVSKPSDNSFGVPEIWSKWGGFGEVLHFANYGPYRGQWQFYRMMP